jgi:hypothetical protein
LVVLVDGKASKLRIKEPALKAGAQITVSVEDEGQEVREIRIGKGVASSQ